MPLNVSRPDGSRDTEPTLRVRVDLYRTFLEDGAESVEQTTGWMDYSWPPRPVGRQPLPTRLAYATDVDGKLVTTRYVRTDALAAAKDEGLATAIDQLLRDSTDSGLTALLNTAELFRAPPPSADPSPVIKRLTSTPLEDGVELHYRRAGNTPRDGLLELRVDSREHEVRADSDLGTELTTTTARGSQRFDTDLEQWVDGVFNGEFVEVFEGTTRRRSYGTFHLTLDSITSGMPKVLELILADSSIRIDHPDSWRSIGLVTKDAAAFSTPSGATCSVSFPADSSAVPDGGDKLLIPILGEYAEAVLTRGARNSRLTVARPFEDRMLQLELHGPTAAVDQDRMDFVALCHSVRTEDWVGEPTSTIAMTPSGLFETLPDFFDATDEHLAAPPPPLSPEQLERLAQMSRVADAADFARFSELLENELVSKPTSEFAEELASQTYFASTLAWISGEDQLAVDMLAKAIPITRSELAPHLHGRLGNLHVARGEFDQAAHHIEQSLGALPESRIEQPLLRWCVDAAVDNLKSATARQQRSVQRLPSSLQTWMSASERSGFAVETPLTELRANLDRAPRALFLAAWHAHCAGDPMLAAERFRSAINTGRVGNAWWLAALHCWRQGPTGSSQHVGLGAQAEPDSLSNTPTLLVRAVQMDGPAWWQGLLEGDPIVRVAGAPATADSWEKAMQHPRVSDRISLGVERYYEMTASYDMVFGLVSPG